ncbi:MAG: DHH family phosphoesterase [Promethearchaeota archaeon]
MDNLNNNTNQNLKIKVVSISHDEDVDGIGAQAIINRYFSMLNSNLIEDLGGSQAYAVFSRLFNEIKESKIKDGEISQDADIKIELINLRTDYTSYFVYWASILAELNQNKSKNEDEAEPDGENLNKLYKQITGTDLIECSSIKRTLKKLKELKEDLKDIDLLIITDLGLNDGSETLIDLLSILKENKINIAYFDHHTHGDVIKEFFKEYCVAYVNDEIQTSAEIVFEFFLPTDEVASRIAQFGADADFNRYKYPETEVFQMILNRKFSDDVLEAMVKLFSEGNFSEPIIDKLYQEAVIWQQEQLKVFKEHTYKFEDIKTSIGKVNFIVSISKLRSERMTRILQEEFKSEVIKEQIEQHVIFIAINTLSWEVVLRSHNISVDKTARKLNGGGHRERAGFILPKEFIRNTIDGELDLDNLEVKALVNVIAELI